MALSGVGRINGALALVAGLAAAPVCGGCQPTLPPGHFHSITSPGSGRVAEDPAPEDLRIVQVLGRLTFGPRPGDAAAMRRVGVDRWIENQLHPERVQDRVADSILALLETQQKKAWELIADHPTPEELDPRLRKGSARDSAAYMVAERTATALVAQMRTGKVLRAIASERQLLEVMVDFWENHFSVNILQSPNRYALVDYDRGVIRPRALGKFRDLLGAVAKSSVMLFYLDNWLSEVDSMHPNLPQSRIEGRRRAAAKPMGDSTYVRLVNHRGGAPNENYARELMELHTLGVNGGYTQADVMDVARALTGWTTYGHELGGGFVFLESWHDAGPKLVLGHSLREGRGIEDGEEVLDIVARHPATARFIATKLVARLVNDDPPPGLVDAAARTFTQTGGDIREVVRTIVTSRAFSAPAAFRAKVKTPFELVTSTARILGARPDTSRTVALTIASLGQPIWGHVDPNGWPDYAGAWMNAGALLSRVNFGRGAVGGALPGVDFQAWTSQLGLATLTPSEQVERIVQVLLWGRASAETRQQLNHAALDAEAGSSPAERLATVVGLALASPEFQRR